MLVGSPAGVSLDVPDSRSLLIRKRAIDLVLGTILSLIALPLVIFLAVGVLLSLRATPFFSQNRFGYGGSTFRVLKLRTLAPSTPCYANKHVLDISNMPLPWFCRMLRRTHLDELPQLFLVPMGKMSLVGPRPRMYGEVEAIDAQYDRARTSVKPGCTGLWQISVAHEGTATGAPRFDFFYLRHASIKLDVWVLIRTVGWFFGAVKPIELTDIPERLLGPGLAPTAEAVAAFADALEPVGRRHGNRKLIGARPAVFLGDVAEID